MVEAIGGGGETLLALMVDCPKDHFQISHKYDNFILINCSSDGATQQKSNFRKILKYFLKINLRFRSNVSVCLEFLQG